MTARLETTAPAATLTKSVFALAIEPITMALSVTGRKAYDVMLWMAQHAKPTADGGYSSPVSAILKGYGSSTKASERVQRYIEQMVQTTVVWRALAPSDQTVLPLGEGEGSRSADRADETRTFALLAEARLYVQGGQAWVTWYYPPSIREQLISPERWAQIELQSIARLTTYTAVALYEICARYKDSPGGLTSRHELDFWTRVLREGGGLKPREFRKFKHELLLPAIEEINAATEIRVELLEQRERNSVKSAQFRVERRAVVPRVALEPVDITVPLRAAKLGVREMDMDQFVTRYGSEKVAGAMSVMEAQIADRPNQRIANRSAYLKAILANRFSQSPSTVAHADSPAPDAPPSQKQTRGELIDRWKAERFKQLKADFAALALTERERYLEKCKAHRHYQTMASAAVKRRIAEGNWESPLVAWLVVDVFAVETIGADWNEPTDIDLEILSGTALVD